MEALAIGGDRVLAAGPADNVVAFARDGTRMVDLDGRVAVPGLNDAHMHLLLWVIGMTEVNLRVGTGRAKHRRDPAAPRRPDVKSKQPGQWVVGAGYDHNELAERRHPTVEELDRIAPDNPVYIKRTCGHVGVVIAGAAGRGHRPQHAEPGGGLIERRDNKLTGLLAELAMRPIVNAMPKPSRTELLRAIEKAGQFMLSQGFTSVMDAAVGMRAEWTKLPPMRRRPKPGGCPCAPGSASTESRRHRR